MQNSIEEKLENLFTIAKLLNYVCFTTNISEAKRYIFFNTNYSYVLSINDKEISLYYQINGKEISIDKKIEEYNTIFTILIDLL